METLDYKQYSRNTRIQTVEENFGLGMQSTDNPLAESYCKYMVNMDIKDSGEILTPRSGLRTTMVATRSFMQTPNRFEYDGDSAGSYPDDIDPWSLQLKGTPAFVAYTKDMNQPTEITDETEGYTSKGTPLSNPDDTVNISYPLKLSEGVTAGTVQAAQEEKAFVNFKNEKRSSYTCHILDTADMLFDDATKPNSVQNLNYYKFYSLNNIMPDLCNVYTLEADTDGTNEIFTTVDINKRVYIEEDPEDPMYYTPDFKQTTYHYRGLTDGEQYYLNYQDYIKTRIPELSDGVAIHGMPVHLNINGNQTLTRHLYPVCTDTPNGLYYIGGSVNKRVTSSYNPLTGQTTTTEIILGASDYLCDKNHASITPRELTPKEAMTWGYNQLLDNPYSFSNVQTGSKGVLTGLIPYNADGTEIILNPKYNQTITLKAYYTAPDGTYSFKFQWKSINNDVWNDIGTVTASCPNDVAITFVPPTDYIVVKVEMTAQGSSSIVSVMELGLTFAEGTNNNLAPVKYNIANCACMTWFQNRLVVGNVSSENAIANLVGRTYADGRNLVFLSDINSPDYFPYPQNYLEFDDEVIAIKSFLEQLLVFTKTKLYVVTQNEDGLTFTQKCIQQNLDISVWDSHLIQVVQNMVFFKSGNYFYMVVPKTNSTTGELQIAPISRPIKNLLDNFKPTISELYKTIYNEDLPENLVTYYNFLDFEDVHMVYAFDCGDSLLNVDLLYNTLNRSWRIYFFTSTNTLHMAIPDATKRGTYIQITKATQWDVRYNTTQGGVAASATQDQPLVQFLQFVDGTQSDWCVSDSASYLPYICYRTCHHDSASGTSIADWTTVERTGVGWSNLTRAYSNMTHVLNYQYLDTGQRNHGITLKKRYRELQFMLNNLSKEELTFYTGFLIDGRMRTGFYKYEPTQNTDSTSGDFGVITLARVLVDGTIAPDNTLDFVRQLDNSSELSGETVLGKWMLSDSIFPECTLLKLRIPISGKGYSPRMQLLSLNEKDYQIYNIVWVMRQMNSR